MRLAVVGLTHPFRGGISHYTTLLVQALAEEHDVRLYALRKQYPALLFPGRTQLDTSASPLTVPNEPLLVPWRPDSWLGTARAIRRYEPEACVFEYWHPFFAPAYGTVSRFLHRRCKRLWELHNVLPHEASRVTRILARYGLRSADAFLVHAEAERDRLAALCPAAPVRVVPHASYGAIAGGGPDREAARRKLGLQRHDERPLILFFGYVRRYKGLDLLVDAMPRIHATTGARLLVRGEFYERFEDYEQRVVRLGIGDAVDMEDRFVANEEIPLLLAACDLVVMPYRDGTASGVAQLALGAGRPVVVTRVGGVSEVVADGVTGFLAETPTPGAVAHAVERFFAPETDPSAMEQAAQESARQRFGWERTVEAIIELASG